MKAVDTKGIAVDHTVGDALQRSLNSMAQPDEAIRESVRIGNAAPPSRADELWSAVYAPIGGTK